ncbi:MBL fold metallo-hydrolase [Cohnella sp. AR92]|nr:MBL fold metallo-hydrolase [Cohnella sp. AR92]
MDQGIALLPISAPVLGRMDTVYPVVLWDEHNAVLVDTGYPGQLSQLRDALESVGVPHDKITRILVTHQDIDHIGNLQAWMEGSQVPIEVASHALEKPYIEGERRLLKFTDEAIASIDRMPESVPEAFRNGLKRLMLHPPKAPVKRVVAGGERLPWCGGLVAIDTPGHTPGHISLYHEPSRTLLAGDALVVLDGRLQGPDPATTLDLEMAHASIARFASFPIERVVCYHGGLFRDNVMERLAQLGSA